ncbi:MAG: hypothetical protein WD065_05745 [Planctomycetaceae bacterium]
MKSILEVGNLPTPIALVANRVNLVGMNASSDTFLYASYLFEAFLKSFVIVLNSGIRSAATDEAYAVAYDLVRADGLGQWTLAIPELIASSTSREVPADVMTLCVWINKKRTKPDDGWARDAYSSTQRILELLSSEIDPDIAKKLTVGHILSACVQIRNKTRGHLRVQDALRTFQRDLARGKKRVGADLRDSESAAVARYR